jgi:hypothetical protein
MPSLQLDLPARYDTATKRCEQVLGVDPDRIKVEFTQHAGDEMYHPHLGGFNQASEGDQR